MSALHRALVVQALFGVVSLAQAQQSVVEMTFSGNDGERVTVEATLTLPEGPATGKRPAMVILHHAGGWRGGATTQYATLLASQGFVTLEPRMFEGDGEREDTYRHMP